MRWRALQTGCIYVRQHPHDAQLSVEELRGMVGREGESFTVSYIMLLVYVATARIGINLGLTIVIQTSHQRSASK